MRILVELTGAESKINQLKRELKTRLKDDKIVYKVTEQNEQNEQKKQKKSK